MRCCSKSPLSLKQFPCSTTMTLHAVVGVAPSFLPREPPVRGHLGPGHGRGRGALCERRQGREDGSGGALSNDALDGKAAGVRGVRAAVLRLRRRAARLADARRLFDYAGEFGRRWGSLLHLPPHTQRARHAYWVAEALGPMGVADWSRFATPGVRQVEGGSEGLTWFDVLETVSA